MSDLTRIPEHVGVIGGGRMGAGIAHAFLMAGCRVTVIEREPIALQAARERIERLAARSIELGAADVNLDEVTRRLQVVLDYNQLRDCRLTVEAVFEDFDVKLEALATAEAVVDERAVLASNTSSLSLTDLAEHLKRPERFLGLRFFNPVSASNLIEVVIAPKTDSELVEAAPKWVEQLAKAPVVVNDSPGFISSRLEVAIALEAIRMVEEGVACAEHIDAAMELGCRHPLGPLKSTDIIGLDVRLGIAEYLSDQLGERFAPPRLLREMVERGELGRKSGKGFYDWS
ncbi:3-hydroxyacyl-CoA dehydrogenase family protein [uncultured Gulosibacter sp.]|uniref:3-hydroxyacyl-CoA dehydrogenase family protein n=1 Tax=uncultured Gulosibacter sp. TaxID=1339167 RepID=UPI00288C11E3|nr:3-hydroxyacyl-CoA dehydrogenase family protein [uncultured Gulosibacter sp.]